MQERIRKVVELMIEFVAKNQRSKRGRKGVDGLAEQVPTSSMGRTGRRRSDLHVVSERGRGEGGCQMSRTVHYAAH